MRQWRAAISASSLVRNTGWMTIGQGANFFLQAGYFLLLVRLLGVSQYGVFAGAFALVNSFAPYASFGTPMLFMRYVSADRHSARLYWGNILLITCAASVLIGIILVLVGNNLIGAGSIGLILTLVLANCFMGQLVNAASTVFQTFEKLKATAGLMALSNSLRLLAIAGLLLTLHHATAFQCSLGILSSSFLAAITAVILVNRHVGKPVLNLDIFRRRAWEGIGFSFAGSTQSVYNDVDKVMLSHYGMNVANGIYTMAYRVVDFATTPVTAIDSAVLPRYFALNRKGSHEVRKMAVKILPISALAGVCAALFTLVLSPVLVKMVGHGFDQSLLAIQWLCWLPALRGVHQLAGGVLTATGRQNHRTAAQLVVAVLNLGLNIIWIPSHGWLGAAWASLISDASLGVLNLCLVFVIGSNIPQVDQSIPVEEHAG